MNEYTVKKCPECGQMLRFPAHIGGVLMACPSCGNTFHSDFKLGGTGKSVPQEVITNVFEMPYRLLRRIARLFHF